MFSPGLAPLPQILPKNEALLALQIVIGDVVGRALVEHADRADVVGPRVRLGADAGARDQRISAQRDRGCTPVGRDLPDREHVLVIDRDRQREPLALRIGPAERHRLAGAQHVRRSGIEGIAIGDGHAVARPAEPGVIGVLGPARREQADRRRTLGDRLLILRQRQVVDPRALQVDRPVELRGFDPHPLARGLAQHDRTVAHGQRSVGGRPDRRFQRLRLALDDLGRGRVRRREELLRQEVAAEQDDRGKSAKRMKFLLSCFTRVVSVRRSGFRRSWDRVGPEPAPGMTPRDSFRRQPSALHRAIAAKRGNCIAGTAWLVTAARRKHCRRADLPAACDQDQRAGKKAWAARAHAASPLPRAWSDVDGDA